MEKQKTRDIVVNLSISLLSILFCFVVSEVYFRFFYIQSDGLGITLAHKRWFTKYWKPINSFGLRDKEWTFADLAGKKVIGIFGDSFVAGHGIKDASERFPDILRESLGTDYAVLNIAKPGWGTRSELEALRAYPSMLNTIVWSYFPNDILDTTAQYRRFPPDVIETPKGFLGSIISHSYFLNFVYWNIYRYAKLTNKHFEWLKAQYNDPLIWESHKKELEEVCQLARTKNADLVIILFPFLTRKINSDSITNKVKDFFESNNTKVIEVKKIATGLKENELVVSKIDAHPSVKLHKLIANNLYGLLINQN